jgi:hypothetical protein
MCFIAAWKATGPLPRGLISRLMIEGQCRGIDGAGLAYRVAKENSKPENIGFKRAMKPSKFVLKHRAEVLKARQSTVGLIHTRRASPRLPITTAASQPLWCGRTIYVHNGYISNWKAERARQALAAENARDSKRAKAIDNDWITDSYAIGPRLDEDEVNLMDLSGSMALAWLTRERVFAARLGKELEGFLLEWKDGETVHTASMVASTVDIVNLALGKIKLEITAVHVPLKEGYLYELEADDIFERDPIPHSNHLIAVDRHSSGAVCAPDRTAIADTPAAESSEPSAP